jgi:hypothetical protein
MDKAFCRMQHDDAVRKDLFQVMEAFSKVKDSDGKKVGPVFKTMKSEFVDWPEAISAIDHLEWCLLQKPIPSK